VPVPLSDDIALADDIVADLQGRSWALEFVPERTWLPEWAARGGELDLLQVSVNPWINPAGEFLERDNADSGLWTVWPMDITVAQRLTEKSLSQIDTLAELVEQLRQHLCPQRFELSDGRVFDSWEFEYLARFDPSQLNRVRTETGIAYSGVFLSALRIPFHKQP